MLSSHHAVKAETKDEPEWNKAISLKARKLKAGGTRGIRRTKAENAGKTSAPETGGGGRS
jgi:hypothetical protein